MKLWYDKPASHWLEALPLGNGTIGAMVFGGTHEERIQFNEDTLWSGYPRNTDNPDALQYLNTVRELIFAGKYQDAHKLIQTNMLSESNNQSYMPFGDLYISCDSFKSEFCRYSNYYRDLDLQTAIATSTFKSGSGIDMKREVFVSFPDKIMVVRLTSSSPTYYKIRFGSDLKHAVWSCSDNELVMSGRAPSNVLPNPHDVPNGISYDDEEKSTRFEARLRISADPGSIIELAGGSLNVCCTKDIILYLSAATSFAGYDRIPGRSVIDPAAINIHRLNAALAKGYDTIRNRHVSDHSALFDRVKIDLGSNDRTGFPIDTRLMMTDSPADDPELIAILFQYGRYLLIASSRPGAQPANAQGIWNRETRPPWSCNMTMNINAEMNYWAANTCALSECQEPFFEMLAELAISGAGTAKTHFGCKGWTGAHNCDIWRFSAPVKAHIRGAFWPMGGAWGCQHIWHHYTFTRDLVFLKKYYHVMRGAAEFILDFLVKDPESGKLLTCPSTSPENEFADPVTGLPVAAGKGSTMDMTLIRELFGNVISANEIIGDDDAVFYRQLQDALDNLFEPGIGSHGQLLEFHGDFAEPEPHHRHVSHLYGVFPGELFTKKTNRALFDAAEVALARRGDLSTGWAMAWRIALWARFGDGSRSLNVLNYFLQMIYPNEDSGMGGGGGIYPNMFSAHPPFQMDGNYGVTAGLTELFLQSHMVFAYDGCNPVYEIELLPSLPHELPSGAVSGLCARGGFVVDLQWSDGALSNAVVKAVAGGLLVVSYQGKILINKTVAGDIVRFVPTDF